MGRERHRSIRSQEEEILDVRFFLDLGKNLKLGVVVRLCQGLRLFAEDKARQGFHHVQVLLVVNSGQFFDAGPVDVKELDCLVERFLTVAALFVQL